MQAESLEEALARAEAFAEVGADVLFIDALASEGEMRRFTALRGVASGVPKMASLLEGGGKTPMVPLATLQAMGFKLVAYPLSLLGVSVAAMQGALRVRRPLLLLAASAHGASWPRCRWAGRQRCSLRALTDAARVVRYKHTQALTLRVPADADALWHHLCKHPQVASQMMHCERSRHAHTRPDTVPYAWRRLRRVTLAQSFALVYS